MTKHFKNVSITNGNMRIDIPADALNSRIDRAQKWLDNRVMTDMLPYMPHETGMFQANTQAISRSLAGTGLVCAGAPPMGRYLYYGKVMVDAQTGKGAIPIRVKKTFSDPLTSSQVSYYTGEIIFRFRRGATLVATDRDLKYGKPTAQARWFEVAKEKHYTQWVNGVQKILDGVV